MNRPDPEVPDIAQDLAPSERSVSNQAAAPVDAPVITTEEPKPKSSTFAP